MTATFGLVLWILITLSGVAAWWYVCLRWHKPERAAEAVEWVRSKLKR